jgi:rhodanese-related sulfurtransferase
MIFQKTGEVVFYCGGGGRASRAAQTLWNAGHRRVFYFGMRDWKRRNLPTAKTAKELSGKK